LIRKWWIMREQLLRYITCPQCGSHRFDLTKTRGEERNGKEKEENREIREGTVTCTTCAQEFTVHNGILDLLPNPREDIMLERRGWEDFIGDSERSDEFVAALPRPPRGVTNQHGAELIRYWGPYADNFDQIFTNLQLKGDEKVLDVGAGRCWSTRNFARKGCYCVALDISVKKFIGLETADVYFKSDNVYFERVLGDLEALPFKDGTFDVIFSSAALHHSAQLERVLEEISRCLSTDGRLAVCNEPCVGVLRKVMKHKKQNGEENHHGINAHLYAFPEWVRGIERAGLIPTFYFPQGATNRVVKGSKAQRFFNTTVYRSEGLLTLAQLSYGVSLATIAQKAPTHHK